MLEKLKELNPVKLKIDEEIIANLEKMRQCKDESSEEYNKYLRNLERLTALRKSDRRKLSPDSCLVVAGNLIGIAMILSYEKTDFIRSKALGFVLRGRV